MAPQTARVGIATVVARRAYVPLLAAWLHSIGSAQLRSRVRADVLLLHCRTHTRALGAIAQCARDAFPATRVSLLESCVAHPSENHTHFHRARALHTAHERFLDTFHWLSLFGATHYELILFLDVDTVVLRPLDGLFEEFGAAGPGEAARGAAPRAGAPPPIPLACVQVERNEACNSGAVLLRPSAAVHAHVRAALAKLAAARAFVLSDQSFFNLMFRGCRTLLDRAYNYAWVPAGAPIPASTAVLHFQGMHGWNKPVDFSRGGLLRYNRSAPDWPVFRIFEAQLAPLAACYERAAARAAPAAPLPPLYPDAAAAAAAPAVRAHRVEHALGNFDAGAKRALKAEALLPVDGAGAPLAGGRKGASAPGAGRHYCALPRPP